MPMPPKGPPGALLQRIIERGRLPNATIDFPRYDAEGNAVAQVYLRPLTVAEQDSCRVNAMAYVAECLSGQRKPDWKPEELEENAVACEILAIACRQPDDPTKPVFEHGVIEMRMHCTTEELAMLFAAYNNVREKSYPSLREMTEAELIAFMRVLEEDAESFPFSRISRSRLEAFSVWAAKSLASTIRQLVGTTSSDSPASPS
jgi:hypothetical protein